jgi:hypothetical protein
MNFHLLTVYNIEDSDDTNDSEIEEFREFYLFIWCILTNRFEIAKTFWRLGNVSSCFKFILTKRFIFICFIFAALLNAFLSY